SLTGEPEGPPARAGLSLVDYMSGTLAAFGLLAAVTGARASGRGTDVDVSLFDTALHNLSYVATWYLNTGHVQHREARSAHPSLVPSQLFQTRDGWLFIMCNKEKFWPLLAARIGRPDWATEPRFASFAARFENRATLTRELGVALRGKTTSEWLAILSGVVPVAPVHDVAEALDNPFVAERGDIKEFSAPGDASRPVRMVASPVRIGGRGLPTRRGPALGSDTDAVLREIGFDAAKIQELHDKKVM
ncbi:MAG: CaiB/BaiF CoA transferase family protein, partial [Acetobacteraceae bacterium]